MRLEPGGPFAPSFDPNVSARPVADLSSNRTACVVGPDPFWREGVTQILVGAGWSASAADAVPPTTKGLGLLILHRASLHEPLASTIRAIRRPNPCVPVVFVFDPDPTSEERTIWIEAGANDVIDKDKTPREFLARVLRATACSESTPAKLATGPFRLDFATRRAWIRETELRLTPTEFATLALLMDHANVAVSHDYIRRAVLRARDRIETSRVRTLLSGLRRKLGKYGALIETIPPRHYRLVTSFRELSRAAAKRKNSNRYATFSAQKSEQNPNKELTKF